MGHVAHGRVVYDVLTPTKRFERVIITDARRSAKTWRLLVSVARVAADACTIARGLFLAGRDAAL